MQMKKEKEKNSRWKCGPAHFKSIIFLILQMKVDVVPIRYR